MRPQPADPENELLIHKGKVCYWCLNVRSAGAPENEMLFPALQRKTPKSFSLTILPYVVILFPNNKQ